MSERVSCPPLELHLTHTCNLTCLGCNHYSNYRLENWHITPKQLEEWAEIWSDRVVPSTFNLLGGEPTLHPDLCELLLIATRYFDTGAPDVIGKECPVCLITNGSFLHRHPRLKNILIERRVRLFLSVHYDRRTDIIERVRAWEREGVAVTIYDYAVRKEWRKFFGEPAGIWSRLRMACRRKAGNIAVRKAIFNSLKARSGSARTLLISNWLRKRLGYPNGGTGISRTNLWNQRRRDRKCWNFSPGMRNPFATCARAGPR